MSAGAGWSRLQSEHRGHKMGTIWDVREIGSNIASVALSYEPSKWELGITKGSVGRQWSAKTAVISPITLAAYCHTIKYRSNLPPA